MGKNATIGCEITSYKVRHIQHMRANKKMFLLVHTVKKYNAAHLLGIYMAPRNSVPYANTERVAHQAPARWLVMLAILTEFLRTAEAETLPEIKRIEKLNISDLTHRHT